MTAIFSLRLACGMMACLLLLSPHQVNPRFYRTHFLTALGLLGLAGFFLFDQATGELILLLAAGLALTFIGSIVWHVEGHPGSWGIIALSAGVLTATLLVAAAEHHAADPTWFLMDDATSAALLGAATTAMLMGHSYLLAPAMSLTPLLTLFAAFGICLLGRVFVAALGLWLWTETTPTPTLQSDLLLWLLVRWGIGLLGPLVLGWLAWETARIRSTQSATGILYVVVILCFLGELTSMVLRANTRLFL